MTKLRTAKKFVSDHRVAIAVVLTSAVWIKLQLGSAKEWNTFLKDHGLFDEYYAQEEE